MACTVSAGHSLGGSIACLAAFDIQQAFGFQRLECYTLGAPRVGNSAFAKSYNEVIPATWHMINDQVPRSSAYFVVNEKLRLSMGTRYKYFSCSIPSIGVCLLHRMSSCGKGASVSASYHSILLYTSELDCVLF